LHPLQSGETGGSVSGRQAHYGPVVVSVLGLSFCSYGSVSATDAVGSAKPPECSPLGVSRCLQHPVPYTGTDLPAQERLTMSDAVAVPDSTISTADVVAHLTTGAPLPIVVEDPETIAARIDSQILAASSVEELFGQSSAAIHARDYLSKAFNLLSVEWRPSSFDDSENSLPFFAILHIVDMDGVPQVITTGARSVMMKAAKAQLEGWLPLSVRIVEADKKTANGYKPLELVAAPNGF